MKHVLLPLLLAVAGIAPGLAQAPADTTAGRSTGPSAPPEYEAPITSFADSINRVFQYVDKTRVPSGILEEYGLQFLDHVPYTGTNGFTAANRMDINRWHALYGDLYGARINANADNLVPLTTVNLRLNLYARDANVELPILHFDYHSIRTDALSGGRIRSVRNRLYDVAGQDPYQRNTAFAVAASNGLTSCA